MTADENYILIWHIYSCFQYLQLTTDINAPVGNTDAKSKYAYMKICWGWGWLSSRMMLHAVAHWSASSLNHSSASSWWQTDKRLHNMRDATQGCFWISYFFFPSNKCVGWDVKSQQNLKSRSNKVEGCQDQFRNGTVDCTETRCNWKFCHIWLFSDSPRPPHLATGEKKIIHCF